MRHEVQLEPDDGVTRLRTVCPVTGRAGDWLTVMSDDVPEVARQAALLQVFADQHCDELCD